MTGVSLPFISAGGTSFLMLLIACGVLLNIGRQGVVLKNNKTISN